MGAPEIFAESSMDLILTPTQLFDRMRKVVGQIHRLSQIPNPAINLVITPQDLYNNVTCCIQFYLSTYAVGNNFSRVCVIVCVSVQMITFEKLKVGSSFSIHLCNI